MYKPGLFSALFGNRLFILLILDNVKIASFSQISHIVRSVTQSEHGYFAILLDDDVWR